MQLFIFSVDNNMYALPLSVVERVYPSAQIVPVQNAPKNILGIVDIQGNILPVMSFQRFIGLDDRELSLNDKFVVMKWNDHRVVLVVDKVFSANEVDEKEFVPAHDVMPDMSFLGGVAKIAGQLVLIQEINELMTPLVNQLERPLEAANDG